MPVEALLLALAAAGLHAFWNLVVAGARDTEAATAVVAALAVVGYAPIAALSWDVDAAVLPYAVASATLELGYLVLLAAAYRSAELSVVYPIARGVAPVLVLAAAVAVLGEATSAGEIGGVVLVALGILLVRGVRGGSRGDGVAFGIAIACCIAAYTLVDSRGIRYASTLAYLELVLAVPAVVYLAAVVRLKGRAAVRRELRLQTVLAAAAAFGAYGLALAALRLASPASVAAVRETSVVIAVGLAAVVLGEKVTAARLAGAVLVAAGVAALALG